MNWLGFCHQVHGSFGVVAKMLGFKPGQLQIVTGGVLGPDTLLDYLRPQSSTRPLG